MEKHISCVLNGEKVDLTVPAHWTLLRLLREKLHLTGTKQGCEIGECGSCTVLMDGAPVNACLVLAYKADGRELQTIEGLGSRNSLHPLQESFIKHGAIQCGFCTPGILMSAKSFLERNTDTTREAVKQSISGHLCRCTGYLQIIEAIEAVSKKGFK